MALTPRQMVFFLNGRPVDALALIVHRSAEQAVGRCWVRKLRKFIILRLSLTNYSLTRAIR